MAVAAIVRKWGNSLGIVLPMDLVRDQAIREDDQILIDVVKEADLASFFGVLQKKK